ncbi:hypothetical protein B0H21DRAFT_701077 [Amylocystis lapponica]|nr:hypothetical protein B0H21DRAFT_701077 [Amylocystis lapponica]
MCTLRQIHYTGDVATAQALGRGWPQKLLREDCEYLLHLAHHKSSLFLDEYSHRLRENRYLPVSLQTIHQTLECAELSAKHVQKLTAEQDLIIHADIIWRISQYPTEYLICLDEVSKDDRTYARLWGRCAVGLQVEQHAPFV